MFMALPVFAIGNAITPTPEFSDESVYFLRACTEVTSNTMSFFYPNQNDNVVLEDEQLVSAFLDITGEPIDIHVIEWLVKYNSFVVASDIYLGDELFVSVYGTPVSVIMYVTTNIETQDAACGMWELDGESTIRFSERYNELRGNGTS